MSSSSGVRVLDASLKPCGYEQITNLSTSQGLTPPTDATLAMIVVEDQAVRWRDHGGAPTATVGMPLEAGDSFTYNGNLHAIEFIEQAAGATLNVSYYK